jgi:hypothetical protein
MHNGRALVFAKLTGTIEIINKNCKWISMFVTTKNSVDKSFKAKKC